MLTRCPRCETTFRVTPEQLKARLGRVRCGHCQNVFNALDTLIEAVPPPVMLDAREEPFEEAPSDEIAAAPEIVEETANELAPTPVVAANDEVVPPPEPEPIEETAEPEQGEEVAEPVPVEDALAEGELLATAEATEPPADTEPELAPEASPADEPADTTTPIRDPLLPDEPAKQHTWPWAIAAALAVIALAVQAALHFRTEISVLYPEAKPLLIAACAPFGCDVPLPRKPELIGIEASALSPEASGKLSLSATLKNRAPFAQQYPNLELTLTDTADQPLVRRVLAPAHYLPHTADAAAGFGADTTLSVNLVVDAPGVAAAGYQLYLFYP